MTRGHKRIFNDFVRTVKQDSHRYYYIKSSLQKMNELNIDVNTQVYGGNTLLHVALKLNNLKLFKLFLKSGVNPNLANENGEAPIHQAVLKNKINFIKALVQAGCDIDLGAELEQTPLHLAVITGNLEIVKYLVDNNAEVLVQDENNNYPIDYAIDEGDKAMIKYFLSIQEVDESRMERINDIIKKVGDN
ncbi:MAG TPA: ankyrin repeat domain-containing protein [Acholeplasmataceae bacterium]|jgi:ankyrin repeat protein|nr:ankyrin repeat domain-containing protein [Acholeplasmataceae bacterium]